MASPWLMIFFLSLLRIQGRSESIKPQEPEFECVDIYNQPSLQHPRLKNHQIQMRPSDEVLAMLSKDASSENLSNDDAVAQFDVPEEGCSEGQVPIHKPRMSNYTKKSFHFNHYGTVGQHAALIQKTEGNPWRGASAWISVYQPKVTKDQFSMVLIWLGSAWYKGKRNSIRFGWAVDPVFYGDYRTRLTTYWSPDDDSDSGCFNIECIGFVQIDSRIFLGSPFSNISVVGGQQYNAFLAIIQDPKTHNWLLTNGKVYIGYWPREILPSFTIGAQNVRYGGFTNAKTKILQPYDIVSPQMGNGNRPLENEGMDLKHTCYMHFVKYVTKNHKSVDIDSTIVAKVVDAPKCYDVNYLDNFGYHRQTFTFGGPGGLCDM